MRVHIISIVENVEYTYDIAFYLIGCVSCMLQVSVMSCRVNQLVLVDDVKVKSLLSWSHKDMICTDKGLPQFFYKTKQDSNYKSNSYSNHKNGWFNIV